MKTERLLELIAELSDEESKKLSLLIRAKYWHLSENYRVFLLKLINSTDIQKSKLCRKEEQLNSRNFQSKRIRFASILEDFIVMISMKKNYISTEITLAHFYHERRLTKNYESKIESIEKLLKNSPVGTDTALHKFQLYELMLSRSRMSRISTDIPIYMDEALNQFYIDNTWRFKCEFYNQEARLNSTLSRQYEETIISKIFQCIFKLFTDKENTSKYYLILKKHITEPSEPGLDEYMIKTVIVYLMTYAAQKVSHGKEDFAIDYIFYANFLMEQNFFLEHDYLDPARYHNTIMAYLVDDRNNIKRIEQFIKQYSSHVFHKKDSAFILQLMDANICFFQGKHQDVNAILTSLKYGPFGTIHKILLAKLEFKLFYEQKEDYDGRMKQLKRISNFVTNKLDLTADKKEAYRSFIRLATKLVNQRLTKDIILQHPNYISVLDRTWLLKKCEQ